ncbi:hypothetical protein KFE25_006971 [Diacronema lutheri]|uniref:2-oxoadipate dioxygenase/decarboxylase n=1 Tax=Diacronema lutheri TaxID=2081491 RepID=A0A8J6CCU1_DIALT|nr:hypothetical protein KFE25_006971 [Diacronema lutheri]
MIANLAQATASTLAAKAAVEATGAASSAPAIALALAALSRTPAPPVAARCVANDAQPVRPSTFEAVRQAALGRYLGRTPSACRAISLLHGRGCELHNDHVALRSFADESCGSGLAFLESLFLPFGYAARSSIDIPGLPVNARWYEPPSATSWPKVFISELRVAELPTEIARLVRERVGNYYLPAGAGPTCAREALAAGDALAIAGLMEAPPWASEFTAADEALLRSLASMDGERASALEYCAWTLTHAHRWNHLTLLVNTLGAGSPAHSLAELNALLLSEGFALNRAGGTDGYTQGSAAQRLEQSSTVADSAVHTFGCGTQRRVPTAFLELIERHDGFGAFLGANARGIFDSTSTLRRE